MSTPREIARHAEGTSAAARRFFLLAVCVLGIALATGVGLATALGRKVIVTQDGMRFPPAFIASTLLLAGCSLTLHRAVSFVRIEKQREFRRWLLTALGLGAAFMGTQTYALWAMLPAVRSADEASLGITPFVIMLAALHGIHFTVAVLFVVLITVRTYSDRYDHEYFWGVRFCAWFWHFLGVAWCAILAVMAIAVT